MDNLSNVSQLNISAPSLAHRGQLEAFCLDSVALYELPHLGLSLDSAAPGASGN